MAGLPGTEAKKDIKNAGNGCGTFVIIGVGVISLLFVFFKNPQKALENLFSHISGGVLSVIGIALFWIVFIWISSLFENKDR